VIKFKNPRIVRLDNDGWPTEEHLSVPSEVYILMNGEVIWLGCQICLLIDIEKAVCKRYLNMLKCLVNVEEHMGEWDSVSRMPLTQQAFEDAKKWLTTHDFAK